VALGDVDGDGHLDVVAGKEGGPNRLYRNNGCTPPCDPFLGVSGTDITADAYVTRSVALGDMNGDGRLDLVAGNAVGGRPNRLYLNNGCAPPCDPFLGVPGTDITADARGTFSVALGDVNGDGHLDLVAGNVNDLSRLYLNNGCATPGCDPFAGVFGSDIDAITQDSSSNSWAVVLGDVDGDGDLDLVKAVIGPGPICYLNNGTADPFSNSHCLFDPPRTDYDSRSLALGDVDGDGDLDLVGAGDFRSIATQLFLNDLSRSSALQTRVLTGNQAAGDVGSWCLVSVPFAPPFPGEPEVLVTPAGFTPSGQVGTCYSVSVSTDGMDVVCKKWNPADLDNPICSGFYWMAIGR